MDLNFYQKFIDKITANENDPVDRARFKMLLYCLTSNLIFITVNVCIFLVQGPTLQLYRALIGLICAVGMLFVVCKWKIWHSVGHFVSLLITFVIWSNLFLFIQGINIPTLQFIFLIIAFSFYVHGTRWGIAYTFLNVIPVVLYAAMDGKQYFYIKLPSQAVSHAAFIYVISYNFVLITFLHYHFFKALHQNIIKLTSAKNHLKQLNSALERAMEKLEVSSQAKMDFLSTMSHELRTPLNGVIGLSNIILMENPREDQKENLDILKFSAENLLSLINDILDLNKLESDKIELEKIPFHLTRLIESCTGSLKLNALNKGLQFEVEVAEALHDKLVQSDPTRLTQVISNLANNALKFTERGYVRLETSVLSQADDILKVRFAVEDSGIGIEMDKQKDIFEPFTQASKSTTRQFGGTGLGLAIVKKILRMFNSEIHILSLPGQGSKFWFDIDFPYTICTPGDAPAGGFKKIDMQGLRVLVAEDNPVNIMVVRKILKQWAVEPVIVENGKLALEYLDAHEVDVILMDLHMPEMDGYQATRNIRMHPDPSRAAVPIIALTASVSSLIGSKVSDAGMNGYLSKPFNPDHLYEKLIPFTTAECREDQELSALPE